MPILSDEERAPMGKTMKKPKTLVQEAAKVLGGNYHESQRGVPLVEMMDPFRDGINYSVCYFGRTRAWRVFEGYLAFNGQQERFDFYRLIDVRDFFGVPIAKTIDTQVLEPAQMTLTEL